MVLLLASFWEPVLKLFSTIAGKSQNLSDVRSEACAVDWSSYYPGHSLLCNNVKIAWTPSKFPGCQEELYKGDECLI